MGGYVNAKNVEKAKICDKCSWVFGDNGACGCDGNTDECDSHNNGGKHNCPECIKARKMWKKAAEMEATRDAKTSAIINKNQMTKRY